MKNSSFLHTGYSILFLCGTSIWCATAPLPYHEIVHQFLWISYLNQGTTPAHHSIARVWSDDFFRRNPPAYVYKDHIRTLLEKKQYRDIINLVPRIDHHTIHDPHIQITIALAYKYSGNSNESYRRFIKLSNLFPTHQEIVFHAAESYIERKELTNALSVINTCLNKIAHKPHFFILYFEKAHIYTLLNDYPQALQAACECVQKNPHFDKGILLAASLCEKLGKISEAITYYQQYAAVAHPNEAARINRHVTNLSLRKI